MSDAAGQDRSTKEAPEERKSSEVPVKVRPVNPDSVRMTFSNFNRVTSTESEFSLAFYQVAHPIWMSDNKPPPEEDRVLDADLVANIAMTPEAMEEFLAAAVSAWNSWKRRRGGDVDGQG